MPSLVLSIVALTSAIRFSILSSSSEVDDNNVFSFSKFSNCVSSLSRSATLLFNSPSMVLAFCIDCALSCSSRSSSATLLFNTLSMVSASCIDRALSSSSTAIVASLEIRSKLFNSAPSSFDTSGLFATFATFGLTIFGGTGPTIIVALSMSMCDDVLSVSLSVSLSIKPKLLSTTLLTSSSTLRLTLRVISSHSHPDSITLSL